MEKDELAQDVRRERVVREIERQESGGRRSQGEKRFGKGRWWTVPKKNGWEKLPQTENYMLDFRHAGHCQLSDSWWVKELVKWVEKWPWSEEVGGWVSLGKFVKNPTTEMKREGSCWPGTWNWVISEDVGHLTTFKYWWERLWAGRAQFKLEEEVISELNNSERRIKLGSEGEGAPLSSLSLDVGPDEFVIWGFPSWSSYSFCEVGCGWGKIWNFLWRAGEWVNWRNKGGMRQEGNHEFIETICC